jgi:hypothetical protein
MSFGKEMVLKVKGKILKNPGANTQYITIPADMVLDSQYPFKPNGAIELEIDTKKGILIVRSLHVP